MAVQNLGNNPVNLIYDYVNYNPIQIEGGRTYSLGIEFVTSQPFELYSYFILRAFYPTALSPNIYTQFDRKIFYTPGIQLFDFRLTPNLPPNNPTTLQIGRFPTWNNVSSTADTNIILRLDPDVFE